MQFSLKQLALAGGIAGSVIAGSYATLAAVRPYMKSDDPPLASTKRVDELSNQVATSLQAVQQTQSIIIRQQIDDELSTNELRRHAVIRDIADLQDELKRHPSDRTILDALDTDKRDLGDIDAEHASLMKRRRSR